MSFKVNREIISSDEVIYDGFQEQAVEFDCILPDYYPDIFDVRLDNGKMQNKDIIFCTASFHLRNADPFSGGYVSASEPV